MDARQKTAPAAAAWWIDRDTEPHVRIGPAQVRRRLEGTITKELDDKGVVTGNPGTDAAPESRLVEGGREVRGVREAGDINLAKAVDRDGAPGVVAGRRAQGGRVDRRGQRGVVRVQQSVE